MHASIRLSTGAVTAPIARSQSPRSAPASAPAPAIAASPACGRLKGGLIPPPMAQNIYDNPEFFAGYSRLGRSIAGLDGAEEWPSLRALLPPLAGLRVLDLGCGFGWFCRWACENGAARVLGVDVSENMLARARTDTVDPAIEYMRADLEQLTLDPGSIDLAYSSL